MFFFRYLRRELRRRMRQAVFIGLGLALGVGLVITASAASAGVKKAQTKVLGALYGVGTDVTVTGAAPGPPSGPPSGAQSGNSRQISFGPNGAQVCTNGSCSSVAGQTVENVDPTDLTMSASKVAAVAGLHDVSGAAGALNLLDTSITFPQSSGSGSGFSLPSPSSLTIDGVDLAHASLGPLSNATLTSGHSFSSSDSDSKVALVDSGFATSKGLKVGSTVTLNSVGFTVIGIVNQPASSNPPDVYIPLAQAQAFSSDVAGSMAGQVNTIYVTAKSAADIATVRKEISSLLAGATVTTASTLAKQVTGSVTSAATLANDLGKWLSIVGLIAAFALATLLTLSAITRRAAEFGTLKAIGWRSRRIVGQVLGESTTIGLVGGVAGVGLGFAGAAIIALIAPLLSATVGGGGGSNSGGPSSGGKSFPGGREVQIGASNLIHKVAVPLSPTISIGVIALAAVLAIGGGVLAGLFASWRIARLRPVAALARVA